MAKKLPNGYTSWILVGLVAFGMAAGGIVWAMRAEGKIEVNKTRFEYVAEQISQINEKIGIILEKL